MNKVTPVMATHSQRSTADLWGRFRFSVVGSLLSSACSRGELKTAIESLAAKTWTHPVTGRYIHFAAKTIEAWYYCARHERDDPVGVLRQAVRKDWGKVSITPALIKCLANQYRDCPQRTYQLHYDHLRAMVRADETLGPLPSYSTVWRYMVAQGMMRKPRLQPGATRKEIERFELKAWLLNIVLSRPTPENVRNELKIETLERITEVARNGAVALRKRALAILARSNGFSEALVAECLNMGAATISRACGDFRHSDDPLQALRRRPRRKDDERRRRMANSLLEILHHNPNAYDVNRSNWTCESLADVYEQQHKHRISGSTVGRCLKEAGYSRKKSRQVLTSPDPEYREKVELVLATLHSLRGDEMFFFIDELGPLQVKRYGGRCYTPRNRTPTHPQNQHSKGSIIFHAALSATTNQVTWVYDSAKDTSGMIDLVELLSNQHHDKSRLYITWDAASWHSSNQLMEWVAEFNAVSCARKDGPMIEFVPLPTSSQFLNVIETVFGTMKKTVIHGSNYGSQEEMKTAISRHFRERNEFFKLNPRRAGTKIWEIDFFEDPNHIRGGNYREW